MPAAGSLTGGAQLARAFLGRFPSQLGGRQRWLVDCLLSLTDSQAGPKWLDPTESRAKSLEAAPAECRSGQAIERTVKRPQILSSLSLRTSRLC